MVDERHLEIASLSYIVIIIAMNLVATFMLALVGKSSEPETKRSIQRFQHVFLLQACAFALLMLYQFIPAFIYTIVSSGLIILIGYNILWGFKLRLGEGPENFWRSQLFQRNLAVYIVITAIAVGYANQELSMVFVFCNYLLLLFLSLAKVKRDRYAANFGEKIVFAWVLASIGFTLVLPIAGFLLNGPYSFGFQSSVIVVNCIILVGSFGALLAMYLADQIQLHYQASITDPMTGLANRRYFHEQVKLFLKLAIRNGTPLSAIVCDLDKFKVINDTYGHDVGDLVIINFAETLSAAGRETDLIARFGGEEFVILLPETDSQGAKAIAERIRSKTEHAELNHTAGIIRFTASFGVAELSNGMTIDEGLKLADLALYQAKESGRNQVQIAPI